VAGWRHQLPDFSTFDIQELGEDDVRQFVGAWYREVLRTQEVRLLGARSTPEKTKEAEARALAEAAKRTALLWRAQNTAEERWREAALLAEESTDGSALEVAGLSLAEDVQVGDELRAEVRRRLLERLQREQAPGAFARLPYGCADMAGNVLEWTRSLASKKDENGVDIDFGYPHFSGDGREDLSVLTNCLRVLRGGWFADLPINARTAYRFRFVPRSRLDFVGFRVALSPSSSDL
jgi:formylglycine-generating enzyme required for sulfatase activity